MKPRQHIIIKLGRRIPLGYRLKLFKTKHTVIILSMEINNSEQEYDSEKKKFVEASLADNSKQIESTDEKEVDKHRERLKREAEIIFDEALRYFDDLAYDLDMQNRQIQIALVSLPETKAQEITERIEEAERAFSPTATEEGYREGSAVTEDELRITEGSLPTLLTAEHATEHIRKGEPKEADWGTGGLVSVLATDHGTFAIVPLGRQTSDANYEGDHAIKEEAGLIIVQKGAKLALSIHGIASNKFITPAQLESGRNSDIAIGIGDDPTEESQEFAEWLSDEARDLDLKVDINPWYMSLSEGAPKTKNGVPLRTSFKAAKPYTTRSHMQQKATESGLVLPIAQIELASPLRVQPGRESNFEQIYKAYILLSGAIQKFGH